nr:hypothetical protein [Candidatus Sigynarchaeum springense]
MKDCCPYADLRNDRDFPVKEAYCMALERFIDAIDFETQCPRRAELAARRHAENVQRHKARAATKFPTTTKPEGIAP